MLAHPPVSCPRDASKYDKERSRSPLATIAGSTTANLSHEQRERIEKNRAAAIERRRIRRIRDAMSKRRQNQAKNAQDQLGTKEHDQKVSTPIQPVAAPSYSVATTTVDPSHGILRLLPLQCYCGFPCARRQVKKQGCNHGRYFYCCAKEHFDSTKCARFHFEDELLRDGPQCRCGYPSKQITWGPGVGEGTRSWVCPKGRTSSCGFFENIDPGPSRAELRAYGIDLPWMGPQM